MTQTVLIQERRTSYRWENKLSISDKQMIAILFLEGFAVYNIARAFNVSTSPVEWHLKEMGVYTMQRKPLRWNEKIVVNRPAAVQVLKFAKVATKSTLPAHIEAIYKRMEREDDEMIRRTKHKLKRYRKVSHLADRTAHLHDDWRTRPAIASFIL